MTARPGSLSFRAPCVRCLSLRGDTATDSSSRLSFRHADALFTDTDERASERARATGGERARDKRERIQPPACAYASLLHTMQTRDWRNVETPLRLTEHATATDEKFFVTKSLGLFSFYKYTPARRPRQLATTTVNGQRSGASLRIASDALRDLPGDQSSAACAAERDDRTRTRRRRRARTETHRVSYGWPANSKLRAETPPKAACRHTDG